MKIDGFGSGGKVQGPSKTKKARATKKAEGKSSAAKSSSSEDSVEIDGHEETLGMIREIVDSVPDVRVSEVSRIVDEIRNGKYKINFEKVAEGFIKEAVLNEIAGRQSRKSDT